MYNDAGLLQGPRSIARFAGDKLRSDRRRRRRLGAAPCMTAKLFLANSLRSCGPFIFPRSWFLIHEVGTDAKGSRARCLEGPLFSRPCCYVLMLSRGFCGKLCQQRLSIAFRSMGAPESTPSSSSTALCFPKRPHAEQIFFTFAWPGQSACFQLRGGGRKCVVVVRAPAFSNCSRLMIDSSDDERALQTQANGMMTARRWFVHLLRSLHR